MDYLRRPLDWNHLLLPEIPEEVTLSRVLSPFRLRINPSPAPLKPGILVLQTLLRPANRFVVTAAFFAYFRYTRVLPASQRWQTQKRY